MHKSVYAMRLSDGSYEYGFTLHRRSATGEKDLTFPYGIADNHETGLRIANTTLPHLQEYFARATYATPSGAVGYWSSVVIGTNHAEAHRLARQLITKQRRVAGKLDMKLDGPGKQEPLVSLPDLSRILHNANVKAGSGDLFSNIATEILSYQVPTPPDYETVGHAAFSRDAGMMIAVQNIVRAALRAIDDETKRCAAQVDLWHGSSSPAAKSIRGVKE